MKATIVDPITPMISMTANIKGCLMERSQVLSWYIRGYGMYIGHNNPYQIRRPSSQSR